MSISAKMLGQITLGASAESPEIISGIQKSSNNLGNVNISSPIETIELNDYIVISVTAIKSIVVFKKSDTANPSFIGIYQVASNSNRGAKICKSGDNNLIGIWINGGSIFACSIFISEDIVSIGNPYTITTDIDNSERALSACSCENTVVIVYTTFIYSSTSASTYGVSAYAMTSSGTSITIGTKKVLVANVAANIPNNIKACRYSNTKLIAGWNIEQLHTTYFHQLTLSGLTITTGASTTFVSGNNIYSIMSDYNYYNYAYYTYANLGNENICVFPYASSSGYYGYFSINPQTLTAGDYGNNVQVLPCIANNSMYMCHSYVLKKEDPKNLGNFITLNQKLLNSISYKSMVVGMTNEYAVLYINREDESALGKFVCVKYIENGINIYPKGAENETAIVIGESGKTKEISSLYFECTTNVSESTDISMYYDDVAIYTENVNDSSKILLSNSPIVLNVGTSIVPKIKKGYSAMTITAFGLEETV